MSAPEMKFWLFVWAALDAYVQGEIKTELWRLCRRFCGSNVGAALSLIGLSLWLLVGLDLIWLALR